MHRRLTVTLVAVAIGTIVLLLLLLLLLTMVWRVLLVGLLDRVLCMWSSLLLMNRGRRLVLVRLLLLLLLLLSVRWSVMASVVVVHRRMLYGMSGGR